VSCCALFRNATLPNITFAMRARKGCTVLVMLPKLSLKLLRSATPTGMVENVVRSGASGIDRCPYGCRKNSRVQLRFAVSNCLMDIRSSRWLHPESRLGGPFKPAVGLSGAVPNRDLVLGRSLCSLLERCIHSQRKAASGRDCIAGEEATEIDYIQAIV
jgi:hypothetical protein